MSKQTMPSLMEWNGMHISINQYSQSLRPQIIEELINTASLLAYPAQKRTDRIRRAHRLLPPETESKAD